MKYPNAAGLLEATRLVLRHAGHELQIRAKDGLDAALGSAEQFAHYQDGCDLYDVAAALFFYVQERHPLVDGNKRLAALSMGAFLTENGVYLDARDLDLYAMLYGVVSKDRTRDELADFLRENCISN